MIRKFGSVGAPPNLVRRIFLDLESWPIWMPGIRAVRILERSGDQVVAEVQHARRPGFRKARLELREHSTGYFERQVGSQAKWEADWRFLEEPRGRGTVVSCRIDFDLGLIGALAPRGMVQKFIDRTFDQALSGASGRARMTMAEHPVASEPVDAASLRIRVFATPLELEIWIGDRKYVCPRH